VAEGVVLEERELEGVLEDEAPVVKEPVGEALRVEEALTVVLGVEAAVPVPVGVGLGVGGCGDGVGVGDPTAALTVGESTGCGASSLSW
jgi:hypothetical protein